VIRVIFSYQFDSPVWSCCYDAKDINIVYCGLSNSTICVLDLRNTKGPDGKKFPVHSLVYVPSDSPYLLAASLGGVSSVALNVTSESTSFHDKSTVKYFNTDLDDSMRGKTYSYFSSSLHCWLG
jgi:hypothetical protein